MNSLSYHNLAVRFGQHQALHPVTGTLPKGKLIAVIGPNGAGKSSLVRALAGLIPSHGEVSIFGKALSTMSLSERARTIAFLPQGTQVYWPLPVRDIVALGRFPHGVSDPGRMTKAHAGIVEDAMVRTEINHLADRRITELSGGEKARVSLARVLAVKAPIIIVDEPTAALDPHYQIDILSRLKTEADTGALVISVMHDLALVARFADHVIVLNEGKAIAEGDVATTMTPAIMQAVFRISLYMAEHEGRPLIVPWTLVP